MPGCIFHVSGENFSAVEFLRGTQLQPYNVEKDGFNLVVSEASGDDFPAQIDDVIDFLRVHYDELEALAGLPDIEARLDFGLFVHSFHDFPAQSLHLPAEFLYLAGSLGINIELSQYAVSDEQETS